MRKIVVALIAVLFVTSLTDTAPAEEKNIQLGKEQNLGIYIDLSVENIDSPGQPVTVGERFRIKAKCVIDLGILLSSNWKTSNGFTLPSSSATTGWSGLCALTIQQKGNEDFILQVDQSDQFKVPNKFPISFDFFDEIQVSYSEEEIYASFASGDIWNDQIRIRKLNGEVFEDSFSEGYRVSDIPLFRPAPKKQLSPSSEIVELDGVVDYQGQPILSVKREASSSYLISITNYRVSFDAKVRASKKGKKSIVFGAKTDGQGELKIRAKRDLDGYLLELVEGKKVVVSKAIPLRAVEKPSAMPSASAKPSSTSPTTSSDQVQIIPAGRKKVDWLYGCPEVIDDTPNLPYPSAVLLTSPSGQTFRLIENESAEYVSRPKSIIGCYVVAENIGNPDMSPAWQIGGLNRDTQGFYFKNLAGVIWRLNFNAEKLILETEPGSAYYAKGAGFALGTSAPSPTPSPSSSSSQVKETTINCSKAGSSLKVTGIKPKCPTGYKKK